MSDGKNGRIIRDWMGLFQELYSDPDLQRTPEQIWVSIMAHCSSIGESIRRIDYLGLLKYAAHAFCWLCSYVNKCNQLKDSIFSFTDCLSGMVSLKYPLICGHCTQNICTCPPERMDKEEDKAAHYEELLSERQKTSYERFTISQWQETFKKIYGGRVHIATLETIGFHFLEEVGEGAMAVRMLSQLKEIIHKGIDGIDAAFLSQVSAVEGIIEKYQEYRDVRIDYVSRDPKVLQARIVDAKIHMVIEIADTFSWFCSILNKVRSISEQNQIGLPSLEAIESSVKS